MNAQPTVVIEDAVEYSQFDDGQEQIVQAQEIDPIMLSIGFHLLHEDCVKSLKKQNAEQYSQLLSLEVERNQLRAGRKQLREEVENYRWQAAELELALQHTQKICDDKNAKLLKQKNKLAELEEELEKKRDATAEHDKEVDLHIAIEKNLKYQLSKLHDEHKALKKNHTVVSCLAGTFMVCTVGLVIAHNYMMQSDEQV